MPSKVVAAVLEADAAVIAAERENSAVLAKSMTIDNKAGGGDRVIQIQDVFTAAVTDGNDSPTEQEVDRYKITAIQGDIITLNEQDLKGVKCLGAMKVYSDVADASCYITVGYEHED
ncbi:hypothetical protein LCGC14_2530490 [marine sediment metagenome]|uniref:Uncharacterized protein n=1 Tax=marine sediment metagenome TaxID=412755 RepID=A0A0F9D570_9ZZZZ